MQFVPTYTLFDSFVDPLSILCMKGGKVETSILRSRDRAS